MMSKGHWRQKWVSGLCTHVPAEGTPDHLMGCVSSAKAWLPLVFLWGYLTWQWVVLPAQHALDSQGRLTPASQNTAVTSQLGNTDWTQPQTDPVTDLSGFHHFRCYPPAAYTFWSHSYLPPSSLWFWWDYMFFHGPWMSQCRCNSLHMRCGQHQWQAWTLEDVVHWSHPLTCKTRVRQKKHLCFGTQKVLGLNPTTNICFETINTMRDLGIWCSSGLNATNPENTGIQTGLLTSKKRWWSRWS